MPSEDRVIGVALPKKVVGRLVQFGRNPVAFVFSIISLYIANAVLGLFSWLTGTVLYFFDEFAKIFDGARMLLIRDFGALGITLLNLIVDLGASLNRVLFALGPAAPFVVAIVGAAALYGVYRLTIALIGEFPGGSTLVDFFQLR